MDRRTFLKGIAALPFVAMPTFASSDSLYSIVSDTYDIVYVFGPYTKRVKPEYRNKVVFVKDGYRNQFELRGPQASTYEATDIVRLKNEWVFKSRNGLSFDEIFKQNRHKDMVFIGSPHDMVNGVKLIKPEFRLDMISTV